MIGVRHCLSDVLIEQIDRDDGFALAEIEIIGDLLLRRLRVHHIADCADTVERVEALDRLRDIRQTEGDGVALLDTEGDKRLRAPLDPPDQLFIRYLLTVKLHGDIIGILPRRSLHRLIHSQLGIIDHKLFIHSTFLNLRFVKQANRIPLRISCFIMVRVTGTSFS